MLCGSRNSTNGKANGWLVIGMGLEIISYRAQEAFLNNFELN